MLTAICKGLFFGTALGLIGLSIIINIDMFIDENGLFYGLYLVARSALTG